MSSSSRRMVFEPGAATTSVATNSHSRNTPRGPKVKRWTSGVSAPGYILLIIVVAWVLVEVMVVERMAWPSRTGSTRARGGGGDGGGSLWVARAIALALAATVALGLWMTHYLDPGVIPPRATIDDDVAWYLGLNRPRANVYVPLETSCAVEEGAALVARFSKDFRGQPIKSVFPERLLDPEDPEGPLLQGGMTPEFCPEAQTFRYCTTCNIWRPPRASHCSECGYCMARFDHHCGVVATCIAQLNHRCFAFMLVSGGAACAVYAAAAIVRASQVCDASLGLGKTCWSGWEVWVLVAFTFWLVYGAVALLGFGVLQAWFLCRDITTKERLGKKSPGLEPGLGKRAAEHWSGRGSGATTTYNDVCCAPVRFRPWYD